MSNFIHRWLNPHCSECITEKHDNSICHSCEVLQMELERLRQENNRLLEYILQKPEPEQRINTEELKMVMPKSLPWKARKQMLENEDREKAKLIKQQSIQE